jgi:carbonic anhydrase/acetyltransferase-like protein (isoleucine patch superfamily)
MRRAKITAVAALALSTLAACGASVGEQALVGGAAGIGTAAVTNGNVGTGAVIGAAANVAYCQSNPGACRAVR